jgi:preprotein translocase subunit SecG
VSQVILIIHLMIALSLIVSVLLQRSEGGGLGIGGGGAGGGLVSSRGSGNFMTKVTAILAAAFMATSLTLAILASQTTQPQSILQQMPIDGGGETAPADPTIPLD